MKNLKYRIFNDPFAITDYELDHLVKYQVWRQFYDSVKKQLNNQIYYQLKNQIFNKMGTDVDLGRYKK